MMSTQHIKEFNKHLNNLCYSKNRYEIFVDFLTMAYTSLANSVYNNEELEKEYMDTVKRYKKEELNNFVQMLSITILALNEKHHDFLGEVFMSNDMGNQYRGQFFTPYSISSLMAQMSLSNIGSIIEEKGWFSLSEPICGSGGMVIAASETVSNLGYNPSEVMYCEAQDIDHKCFMMTYIQLSVPGIPAKVVRGNTLKLEQDRILFTPAFFHNGWFDKFSSTHECNEKNDYESSVA